MPDDKPDENADGKADDNAAADGKPDDTADDKAGDNGAADGGAPADKPADGTDAKDSNPDEAKADPAGDGAAGGGAAGDDQPPSEPVELTPEQKVAKADAEAQQAQNEQRDKELLAQKNDEAETVRMEHVSQAEADAWRAEKEAVFQQRQAELDARFSDLGQKNDETVEPGADPLPPPSTTIGGPGASSVKRLNAPKSSHAQLGSSKSPNAIRGAGGRVWDREAYVKDLKEQADAKFESDTGSRDAINGMLASIDDEIAAARKAANDRKKSPIVISSRSVEASKNRHAFEGSNKFSYLPTDSRLSDEMIELGSAALADALNASLK